MRYFEIFRIRLHHQITTKAIWNPFLLQLSVPLIVAIRQCKFVTEAAKSNKNLQRRRYIEKLPMHQENIFSMIQPPSQPGKRKRSQMRIQNSKICVYKTVCECSRSYVGKINRPLKNNSGISD